MPAYRHHLELALKVIIRRISSIGYRLSDSQSQNLNGHRLDLLWEDLKPMFNDVCREVRWKPPFQADIEGISLAST
jgi:hypothetical protein